MSEDHTQTLVEDGDLMLHDQRGATNYQAPSVEDAPEEVHNAHTNYQHPSVEDFAEEADNKHTNYQRPSVEDFPEEDFVQQTKDASELDKQDSMEETDELMYSQDHGDQSEYEMNAPGRDFEHGSGFQPYEMNAPGHGFELGSGFPPRPNGAPMPSFPPMGMPGIPPPNFRFPNSADSDSSSSKRRSDRQQRRVDVEKLLKLEIERLELSVKRDRQTLNDMNRIEYIFSSISSLR